MAYIKKLKDNELIGGTDNTDVYPVTSTEAVYNKENVSQEYINNHVDGSKIVNGTVTNSKIANGAVSVGKLNNEVQTLIQQGVSTSLSPMGEFDIEAIYWVNDMVYDPVTNSSYVSLRADNVGHPVTDGTWWMKVVGGDEETIETIVDNKIKISVTKQVSPDPSVSYMLRPKEKTLFGETSALRVFIKHPGTQYGPVAGVLNEYMFAFTTPSFPVMTLEVSTGDYPIMWTSGLQTEALTHYEVKIVYDEMQEMYFGEMKSWSISHDGPIEDNGGMDNIGGK